MTGDWLLCKEPPVDPSVTCFLADDVDWLDGKAPEGAPWLCSDSPVMRETPHDGTFGTSQVARDRSSPRRHPPLLRPTRLLGAMLGARAEKPHFLAAG